MSECWTGFREDDFVRNFEDFAKELLDWGSARSASLASLGGVY